MVLWPLCQMAHMAVASCRAPAKLGPAVEAAVDAQQRQGVAEASRRVVGQRKADDPLSFCQRDTGFVTMCIGFAMMLGWCGMRRAARGARGT